MAKSTKGHSKRKPERPRSNTGGTGIVDRRVQASRARVLATTLELLTESGVGGLTVDEVSRRSGVAKTTIYRHWPDRSALILDACSQMAADEEAPDTGSLEGDLTAILSNIAQLLGTARWASILPSIVDVAERDPNFAEIHSTIQRGHAAPIKQALDRAAVHGEIAATVDRSAMTAALMGPLFYRRWFSREPIDHRFIESLIQSVVSSRHWETPKRRRPP
jgi:AcrR family transcriptional regulator